MEKTKYYEIEQEVLEVAEYLKELSYGFKITGNEKVSKNLKYCAKTLEKQVNLLQKVTTKEMMQKVKDLHETEAAILQACLYNNKGD